ncbi:MAG: hypothetical protein HRU17_02435 [Polyangiaceae bacterium]|nr:hypothetical protein [Polyangiaceae bacterium]
MNSNFVPSRLLSLVVLLTLFAPVSCRDDQPPEGFTTIAECVPGEVRACQCSDGHPSNKLCKVAFGDAGMGVGEFSDCDCGGCTSYPNCGGCDETDCLETCLCETSGAVDDCELACNGAPDGGVEASTTTNSCDPAACPGGTAIILEFAGCCDVDNLCGINLGDTCAPKNQPGTEDAVCEPQDLPIAGFELTLQGCCRENGICGAQENFGLDLGCTDIDAAWSSFGAEGPAPEPVSCGGSDVR